MTEPSLALWCGFIIKICMVLGSMLPFLWTQLLSTQKAKVGNNLSFLLGSVSLIMQLEAGPEIHQQEDFDWEDTPQPTNWTFPFPSCVIGISSIRS